MTYIADYATTGYFPLQDHSWADSNTPLSGKQSMAAVRLQKHELTDNASDPSTVISEDNSKGVIGDVHPWVFMQTKDRGDRGMGSWSQAMASVITSSDAHYQKVDMRPVQLNTYNTDIRYEETRAQNPTGFQVPPKGSLVLAMSPTTEEQQQPIVMNVDPRLIAATDANGAHSTLVCDVDGQGEICMDQGVEPGLGGRAARLHSLLRVVPVNAPFAQLNGASNYNTIALNWGRSRQDSIGNYGACFMTLSGPSIAGPTTGGPATGGPITGVPTVAPLNAPPNSGQVQESKLTIANDRLPVVEEGNTFGYNENGAGQSFGGGGIDFAAEESKAINEWGVMTPNPSGEAIALMAHNDGAYGPITAGSQGDKHLHGYDADGNPIHSAHISTEAFFFRDNVKDAPLEFSPVDYPDAGTFPLASQVHCSYHANSLHAFKGSVQTGKWRWWSEVDVVEPDDPDNGDRPGGGGGGGGSSRRPGGPTGQPGYPNPGTGQGNPTGPTTGPKGPTTPGPTTGGKGKGGTNPGRTGRGPSGPTSGLPLGPEPMVPSGNARPSGPADDPSLPENRKPLRKYGLPTIIDPTGKLLHPLPGYGPHPGYPPFQPGGNGGDGGIGGAGPITPGRGGGPSGNVAGPCHKEYWEIEDETQAHAGSSLPGNHTGLIQPGHGPLHNVHFNAGPIKTGGRGGGISMRKAAAAFSLRSSALTPLPPSRLQAFAQANGIVVHGGPGGAGGGGTQPNYARYQIDRGDNQRNPWTGEHENRPGIITTVGSNPEQPRKYATFRPMHTGFAAVSFRPQLMVQGAPNFEHNPQLPHTAYKLDERDRPSVLTLRAFGHTKVSSGDFGYVQRPANSSCRGGTSNGGILLSPPRFELEDYYGINSAKDVSQTTGDDATLSHMLHTPGVKSSFGLPTITGDLQTGGVQLGQTSTAKPLTADVQTSAAATSTAFSINYHSGSGDIQFQADGTGSIQLPKGTTAERPSNLLDAGSVRYNTTTTKTEVYNGSAWENVGGASGPIATSGLTCTAQRLLGNTAGSGTSAVEEISISTSQLRLASGQLDLAPLGVSADKLASGSVTTAKIDAGAVTTNEIGADAVTNAKMADNAVTTAVIRDAAVTTAKLATGAVNAEAIGNGAVETSAIADDAVTEAKLADTFILRADRQVGDPYASLSTTSLTQYYSFAIPGGTLATRTVRVHAHGTMKNNSGSQQNFKHVIRLGGVDMHEASGSIANDADQIVWIMRMDLSFRAAGAQFLSGEWRVSSASTSADGISNIFGMHRDGTWGNNAVAQTDSGDLALTFHQKWDTSATNSEYKVYAINVEYV
mgnify:CR=1 FL=1|tara:strand:+ start:1975 stop:5913 length:3939 start_codon:yes stop_codon:yes gene_type:complete